MDLLQTKRQALGQLVFCQGCCCGRTDRGKPELPVEALKAIWSTEKLNRTIQLTISGCLGPCDCTNVTLVLMGTGENIWLGGLAGEEVYLALIDWARQCDLQKQLIPLPELLDGYRLQRFAPEIALAATT